MQKTTKLYMQFCKFMNKSSSLFTQPRHLFKSDVLRFIFTKRHFIIRFSIYKHYILQMSVFQAHIGYRFEYKGTHRRIRRFRKPYFCIISKFSPINIHFTNFGFSKKHIEICACLCDKSRRFADFPCASQKKKAPRRVLEILLVLPQIKSNDSAMRNCAR